MSDAIALIQNDDVRELLENMLKYGWPQTAEDLGEAFLRLEHDNDQLRRNPIIQIREFHDDGRGYIDDWRDVEQGRSLDDFIEHRPTIQVRIKP